MNSLILKLLPYANKGLYFRKEDNTFVLGGLKEDIDLNTLRSELENEWINLVRQEAIMAVKRSLSETIEKLRPNNFTDLVTKLQLGVITEEQRQILINYYNQINNLEQTAKNLENYINNASSVEEINNINWPEWITWNPLPTEPNFVLEVDQTAS
jgi:predicted phage-related endonuclease